MTKVTLRQVPGKHYSLTCEGHATGSTEVCAAISCLASSLEGWLENSDSAEAQKTEVRPGFVQIIFTPAQAQHPAQLACQEVFNLAEMGFLRLEAGYPAYLSVTREII